jgi:hypothetical protein
MFPTAAGIPEPEAPVDARSAAWAAARGQLPFLGTLPFAINLVANLIFTPIQVGMRNLPLAAVDILVVYRQEYGDHGLWVRPAAMFAETVMVDGRAVPRFTACDAPASGG